MAKPRKAQTKLFTALPFLPPEEEFFADLRTLLGSQLYTNRGPWVQRFEAELLAFIGDSALDVATCSNATQGLEMAIAALGMKKKVIVTPFTFVASVHSIVRSGLEPVFADIDPETFCLSPASVEDRMEKDVSGVLAVHAYGNLCDVESFDAFRKRGVKVLYDSAHAFGVRKDGVVTGSYGDAEVFSFHSTKVLHSFEGGAITSRDRELVRRIKMMMNFGITSETEVECVGTNAKMSEVHALMGIYSLRYLDQLIANRKAAADSYRSQLRNLSEIELMKTQPGVQSNYQYFPILLPDQTLRDSLYEHLKAREVISRRYFYPPVHQLAPYRDMAHGPLPVVESVSRRILCLPMHSYLTAADVDYVCELISSHLSSGKRTLRAA